MRTLATTFFVLILNLWIATTGEANTVHLLTIGNSFADNALVFLPSISEAAGHELIVGRANIGGSTLERHWMHVAKGDAPYRRRDLEQMLKLEPWDVVTLQQVSYQSHDIETFHPYARNLYDYIRTHAPQATILFHQTWAYRVDDPRFKPENEGKHPHTHQVMYEQVRAAYHTIASELDVGLLPSGDAMYLADTDPTWGFKPGPDFVRSKAVYPNIPEQSHSLHVGYAWRTKDASRRLAYDGHHASQAGKYLIGCVWFEVLFKESVIDNSFVPKDMDPEYAAFLRQTAHRAVVALQQEQSTGKSAR